MYIVQYISHHLHSCVVSAMVFILLRESHFVNETLSRVLLNLNTSEISSSSLVCLGTFFSKSHGFSYLKASPTGVPSIMHFELK
jgi:hypothetical protein